MLLFLTCRGSIYQYADKELGFSSTRTGDFLRLARKLEELPRLKKELAAGTIGYTKAREIIKVAEVDNEQDWLTEARRIGRDALAGVSTQRPIISIPALPATHAPVRK